MAKRKWLLGASGVMLAGGIAALPRPAAADLVLDMRLNTAASTGLAGSSTDKNGVLSGSSGTLVVDLYGTVTDANPNSVSIGAVGGSFLSTGAIQGTFAPNGATGWSGTGIPPEGTVKLVGLRTATYDFSGTGSQPGTVQDIDGDGDNDLGSPNANAPDAFVYMREASPDNASGTAVTGGKQWKLGSVTFAITSAGAGTPTQLKFEPRRNAAGALVPETAWWFEGDMVSATNPDGIAYPTLPGSVLDFANAFVTISAVPPSNPGDADGDGDVDGVDISRWGQNFTGTLAPGTGGKTVAQGDFDGDADVDGNDAAIWGQNFTGELGGGGLGLDAPMNVDIPVAIGEDASAALASLGFSVSVVPEPGVLGLAALAGVGLLGRRNRRR